MKKIDLDFHKNGARSGAASGLLLLLIGILAVVWIVIIHNDNTLEQSRIKLEIERYRGLMSDRSSSDKSGQDTARQFEQAVSVIEQLSFPWSKLFQALEENAGKDMTLLAIQPDMVAGTVTLSAEAKNWDGMVSYIKLLEEDGFFSDVHLVSHQTQQANPQLPVRFKLSCRWSPPPDFGDA